MDLELITIIVLQIITLFMTLTKSCSECKSDCCWGLVKSKVRKDTMERQDSDELLPEEDREQV